MEVTNKGMRIDFIGSPGSGKSSLINALGKIQYGWKARSNFIQEILSTCYRNDQPPFSIRLKSLYHMLQGKRRVTSIDKVKLKLFYSEHFDIHKYVLRTAYQTLSDDEQEREFVKSVRLQLLDDVLKDQLLFEHHKHSASVGLFDDSFCNMLLLTILPFEISESKFIEWATPIRSSHFPDGVICLEADCDTLYKRIKKRNRTNSSHLQLNDKELIVSLQNQIDIYKRTENLLRSIGIPLINIPSKGNQDNYIEQCKDFIISL